MARQRKVIRIDEAKCDGCGQCVLACAEGAIAIVDGKAKLVSDTYCDGLGACLGECPQGALTIEEREAAEFDEAAVREHLDRLGQPHAPAPHHPAHPAPAASSYVHHGGGCPGSAVRQLRPASANAACCACEAPGGGASELGHWPVQLHLVPPRAPFLQGADLLLAADCTAFAVGDFHARFLGDHVVTIACPKLDDTGPYLEKLTRILSDNDLRSLHVVQMEVPCCSGLERLTRQALSASGKELPLQVTTVGVRGDVLRTMRERPHERRPAAAQPRAGAVNGV
ncbi:MAG: 4Fe-4S binding protein [Deltaproteobacteria bacterium]|nr:4Fe-4S binding protein [Deltaproteobacteria bacterium]